MVNGGPPPLTGCPAAVDRRFAGTRYRLHVSTRYEIARHVSTRYCSGGGWTNQSMTRGTGLCQYE
ncbi:hypothetical protein Tco_1298264, partial [Tanacetum coccineum]